MSNSPSISAAVDKLQEAGLANLDTLPLAAIKALASLPKDEELDVLAKVQRELSGVHPLGFGNLFF